MSLAKSFTDLKMWQEGHNLVLAVYKHTEEFPRREDFGLTSQIRRSAGSIASNITEGFERGTKKEFIRFLVIARGSLAETQNHLLLARDLGYLKQETFHQLAEQTVLVHKLMNGFIRSLRTSSLTNKRTS